MVRNLRRYAAFSQSKNETFWFFLVEHITGGHIEGRPYRCKPEVFLILKGSSSRECGMAHGHYPVYVTDVEGTNAGETSPLFCAKSTEKWGTQ